MTERLHLSDSSDIITIYRRLGGSRGLRRVIELAFRNGANTIDIDIVPDFEPWLAELSELKSRYGLSGYVSSPQRLDFLALEPNKRGRHVGYAILRPAPNSSILEAVIPPEPVSSHSFLTCGAEWECLHHTGSSDLSCEPVFGAKFIQQDPHIGVCAHACIRSVSLLLNRRFGSPELTFGAITDIAGCFDPRIGLTYEEMKRALESMNCDVFEFSAVVDDSGTTTNALRSGSLNDGRRPDDVTYLADEVIYRYVESGLPVIVGVPTSTAYHTLFAVGHSFDRDSWWPEALIGYYPSLSPAYEWLPSSLWTGTYFIQDDNFGPYMSMPKEYARLHVMWVMVPVPKSLGLTVTAEAAEALVAYYLYNDEFRSRVRHPGDASEWAASLLQRQQEHRVVLRTLLVQRDDFVKSVSADDCLYPRVISEFYRDLSLPAWFWLVEVSTPELFGSSVMKLGEFLIDPRASEIVGFSPTLALHVPGIVWGTPTDPAATLTLVDDDRPTTVFTRPSFAEYSTQV